MTDVEGSQKRNSDAPIVKSLAMLVFLASIWLFSCYLFFSGELNEELANALLALATLVLVPYSFFFWRRTAGISEKSIFNKRHFILELFRILIFVAIIVFNSLFAFSIQHQNGSIVASALLWLSMILWVIPSWKYRVMIAVMCFLIAFCLAEIGFY